MCIRDRPNVVADIAPVHSLISMVMKGIGEPQLLIPQNASPHHYAMRPSEARALQEANLVVYLGHDMTPWLEPLFETVAASAEPLDLSQVDGVLQLSYREGPVFGEQEGHDDHDDHEGHDHEEEGHDEELAFDPHSWLDPLAFKVQADVVLQHLIEVFPEGEDTFTANAEEFKSALDALHVGFDAALNDGVCTDKTVVANHNAYSYMAYRYDIQFLTVHGLDPEGEPSAEDVAEVVEHINEEGITVLFVEEYTDQESVQSIVDETGVSIQILYTMEMAPTDDEDDYMSMMQKNLDNMLLGMGC